MPLNPNLKARLDQRRIQNGELSPFHKGYFVPTESPDAQEREMVEATGLVHRILNPDLGIKIEGIDTLPVTNTSIQSFHFSIQADKLPTYNPGEFWSWKNRAVDLIKLFDPTKTQAYEDMYRKTQTPLKRSVTLLPADTSPYITEQQALAGIIGEDQKPTVLLEVLAKPFIWSKDSHNTGEDKQRALIMLTTQPSTAYIDQKIQKAQTDTARRLAELQTEIDAAQRESVREEFEHKALIHTYLTARDRLVRIRTEAPQ